MDDLSTNPLTIAFPSKGRLKEQAEAWLAECGFKLEAVGGARGYRAAIAGLPGAQVQLLSASDIAQARLRGDDAFESFAESRRCLGVAHASGCSDSALKNRARI